MEDEDDIKTTDRNIEEIDEQMSDIVNFYKK